MASAIVLLLFLVLAAPALLAFVRRDVGWRTGGLYGAALLALLGWHVGFAVGPMPSRAALSSPGIGAAAGSARCDQALDMAQRGGIVLDRSNPSRLVVNDALWQQLPDEVRAALTECADSLRPADRRDEALEVVNRAP